MTMKNCEPLVSGPALAIATDAGGVAVVGQLVGERVAGAAAARALGVAALDDEAGHDAVEGQPVVEALAGEEDEVVDRRRAPRPRRARSRSCRTTWRASPGSLRRGVDRERGRRE